MQWHSTLVHTLGCCDTEAEAFLSQDVQSEIPFMTSHYFAFKLTLTDIP